MTPDPSCTATRHGRKADYDHNGCRCPEARAARERERKKSRWRIHNGISTVVPAVGSMRRLQALAFLGWGLEDLVREMGIDRRSLNRCRSGLRKTVTLATARTIDRHFRRLCMTPGPSSRAAGWAKRNGWASPLMWDNIDDPAEKPVRTPRVGVIYHLDEVAIVEAMSGRRVKLSYAERREVIRRLSAAGLNASEIGERLGAKPKTVQKAKQRGRRRQEVAA